MKAVVGYLLDPITARVRQIHIPPDAVLNALYAAIGCERVETVQIDAEHDLWLDEDGWLKPQQAAIAPVPNPFSRMWGGRGVVLSHDDAGEIAAPKMALIETLTKFVACQAMINAEHGAPKVKDLAGVTVLQQSISFRATVEIERFQIGA